MRKETINDYRPELVKFERPKTVILNFNVEEVEDGYTCDSTSFGILDVNNLDSYLEKDDIVDVVTMPELIEALTTLDVTDEDKLTICKNVLRKQITLYDISSAVNSFTIGGQSMWLDKATRVGLMNSITIEKNSGRTTTTLWLGDNKFQFPVDAALQMLSMIELYALECYNVTSKHLVDIANASSLDFVSSYDITQDYPEPPVMEL